MKLEDILKSQKHALLINLKRSIFDCVAVCDRNSIEKCVFDTISEVFDDNEALP